MDYRQATQEQTEDSPRYGEGQGREEEEGRVSEALLGVCGRWRHLGFCGFGDGLHVCAHHPQWLSISCIGGVEFEFGAHECNFNQNLPLQFNTGVCLSASTIIRACGLGDAYGEIVKDTAHKLQQGKYWGLQKLPE